MKKICQENSVVATSKRGLPLRSCVPRNEGGFSIIEVLIFTLLSSMVLIALSYATLVAVRTSQSSQNKTLSTRFVQQAQEWLKGQKEVDWSVFVSTLEVGTYCLNTIPDDIAEIVTLLNPCATTDFTLSNRFKRELVITSKNVSDTEIAYTVFTYWYEGKVLNRTQVSGLFALWE